MELIKCPVCGYDGLLPTFKRCPKCGRNLQANSNENEFQAKNTNTNTYKNTKMSIFGNKNEMADDLKLVKNTVFWNLNPGEVARRINVSEFDKISNARGVYIQEGVLAVLMIDGNIVAKLTSGVYYFPTAIERFSNALKQIWRFFAGDKAGSNDNEGEIRRGRLGSELQNISKQSLIDVVLVTEGTIPVVLGVKAMNGTMEFCPYTIHANLADVEVGVSMNLEITDFYKFRINYLTKKTSCRIHDLQAILNDPVRNTLQEVLAYETVEAPIFSPDIRERLRNNVMAKANAVLIGAEVSQVIDITLRSEDFERFREIEHKLYCSQKELDYLVRTNDFKNRLQSEENAQIIKEAKSNEELRYALNNLNKDELIHDDEMEAFCTMLAAQKTIREAQSDAEVENALRDIEKTKLISKDDLEALESELRINKGKRDEVENIFLWQSLRRTETERISAQKDIEQGEFERDKQMQSHANELEKDALEHIIYKNDVERGEQRKDDEYGDERRTKTHQMNMQEAKDTIELQDDAEKREIERARIAQENALNALSRMKEEDRKDKAQDYNFTIESEKLRNSKEIEELKLKTGMTAEQLATLNFDKMSTSAQEKFAEAFSSQRGLNTYKQMSDEKMKMMEDFMNKTLEIKDGENARQEKMMKEMMEFMKDAMHTNANVANNAVTGHKQTMDSFMSTMKDVSTHRLNEVESDKQEYKAEAHHAQSRMDHTQDSALRYTTRVSEADAESDAIRNSNASVVYVKCKNCGADGEQGGICPECNSKL